MQSYEGTLTIHKTKWLPQEVSHNICLVKQIIWAHCSFRICQKDCINVTDSYCNGGQIKFVRGNEITRIPRSHVELCNQARGVATENSYFKGNTWIDRFKFTFLPCRELLCTGLICYWNQMYSIYSINQCFSSLMKGQLRITKTHDKPCVDIF